ncbi:MAG: TonB-dependent siderophore receptor [Pseudomonadales bacterium]
MKDSVRRRAWVKLGSAGSWGLCALTALSLATPVLAEEAVQSAEEDEAVELETFVTSDQVEDDLGVLQSEPVNSVFGFGKTILETPRAVSSINAEFLKEFNVNSINDIVSFVPGTFTTSFFGVAGSLDIRGTSAENYFRGVKRLNNEGNYPTPIGASDRIDVIRGPMSPISGPSKVGGALNFIPKSARAETGQYLESSTGSLSYRTGSWDESVVKGEIGGPVTLAGRPGGYYLYAEVENSGSYFTHDSSDQNILQGSLNLDLTDSTRIEAGIMYQEWRGYENGGWNRVTQDLIDHGRYISGDPAVNIDAAYGNADGLIQEREIDAWEAADLGGLAFTGTPFVDGVTCFRGLVPFCFEGNFAPLNVANVTQGLVDQLGLGLDPATVRTVKLDTNKVLITPTDKYNTDAGTFYFDIIHTLDSGVTITNKLFYDSVEYTNIDGYGFTKVADSWVIEDQLIIATSFESGSFKSDLQFSPSIRYTDAFYANDFSDEVFDRVDLARGFSSFSLQQVPSRDIRESWSDYLSTEYTQYGLSFLADNTIGENLSVLLGARMDYIDIEAQNGDGDGPNTLRTFDPNGENTQSGSDDGFTWTASVSYKLPGGFTPYATWAEQTTIISGAAAEVSAANVFGDTFLGDSEMFEAGIKASLLEDRLFAAVAYFDQERIAFNSQNPVNNQATQSDGIEAELRYVLNDRFAFMATYSKFDVFVLQDSGVTFSYIGATNIPNIDPASIFGGIIGANHPVGTESPRGGIPEVSWSLSGTQRWTDAFSTGFSFTHVDEVYASVLGGPLLPEYDILNLNAAYDTEEYRIALYLNNVFDEEYFRGNFPSLYGNSNILPGLPFSWSLEATYKF